MTLKPGTQSALLGVQYVYYIYDEEDVLLYVGITGNLKQRMNHHRSTKGWWPEKPRIESEEFPDRRPAEAREAELIERLSPPYNQPPRPLVFARIDPALFNAMDRLRGDVTRARFVEVALANEVTRRTSQEARLVVDQL